MSQSDNPSVILDQEAALYSGPGDAEAVLRWGLETYGPRMALACSFSAEDICVLHLMTSIRDDVRVFAIDTGRLNEETYACAEHLRRRFGIEVEWYFPRHEAVEGLLRDKGPSSFLESVKNRHECCHIRKVEPLGRALDGLKAWVTGMRREQSVTRAELHAVEVDSVHENIAKLNPLASWSEDEVWACIKQHKLPYNALHDQGYSSIGCAPCTRATKPGEDTRAGRWWWENLEHKECGLHISPGRP